MTTNELEKKGRFRVPKELVLLAKLFEENGIELFVVGGYTRDWFLQVEQDIVDIDICSSATPEQITKILTDTVFQFELINKKLGTFKIKTRNCPTCFEHTTFRKEIYDYGHKPSQVEFVADVSEDAKRRDFTINAIYYNITKRQFFDPFNGIADCESKQLKMVADYTFDSDGLRILRMVRFAFTKRLEICEHTYKKARGKSYLLREISHERIAKELRAISLYQQSIISQKGSQKVELLKMIFELEMLPYIFPELKKYVAINLLNRNAVFPDNVVELCNLDLVVGLIYFVAYNVENITKQECMPEFYFDMLATKGLMLTRNIALRYRVVVDGLLTLDKMYDKSFFVSFVQLYFPFLPQIVESRNILTRGGKDEKLHRLCTTERLMVANNIPRHLGELNLNANDIIKNFPSLDKNLISHLLEFAMFTATRFRNNEKNFLIKKIEEHLNDKGEKL